VELLFRGLGRGPTSSQSATTSRYN